MHPPLSVSGIYFSDGPCFVFDKPRLSNAPFLSIYNARSLAINLTSKALFWQFWLYSGAYTARKIQQQLPLCLSSRQCSFFHTFPRWPLATIAMCWFIHG
jgi:hypothetical protein